jgi:hypothetical protein
LVPETHGARQEDQHFGEDDQAEAGGNFSIRFNLFSGQHYGKEDGAKPSIHAARPPALRHRESRSFFDHSTLPWSMPSSASIRNASVSQTPR